MTTEKKYSCSRCGYLTAVRTNILAHLKKQKPCPTKLADVSRDTLLNLHTYVPKQTQKECSFCKKHFSYKNFNRHTDTCQEKHQLPATPTIPHPLPVLNEQIEEIIQKRVVEEVAKYVGNTNVTNVMSVNNLHIHINSFGNEDLSHLSPEFLSKCLLNPTKGITNLIDNIHYNESAPTNNNIRHKSRKNNTFEKYLDNHWIECDASNTLDELIRKGYRVMNTHFTEYYLNSPEFEDDTKLNNIQYFRFLADTSCAEYFAVKRDLRLHIKNKTLYFIAPPCNKGR